MKINKIDKVLKEVFEKIIKESNTISEVLSKIGVNNRSSKQYNYVYKRVERDNLTIEHFNIKKKKFQFYSLDEILIENSQYTSIHRLKSRLVKEKLIEYKCEICNNNGIWLNKIISLQLDHKNGVNNDNRLENLRFLCPNCHSQTSTFSGKNLKNKKIFEELNENDFIKIEIKEKNVKQKRILPPLEELVLNVKEYGYSATGRKYSVSDNSIRKWINKLSK